MHIYCSNSRCWRATKQNYTTGCRQWPESTPLFISQRTRLNKNTRQESHNSSEALLLGGEAVIQSDKNIRICGDYKVSIHQVAKPDIYISLDECLFFALNSGVSHLTSDMPMSNQKCMAVNAFIIQANM